MKARTVIAAAALLALAACGGGGGGSMPPASAFSTASEAPAQQSAQPEQPAQIPDKKAAATGCTVAYWGDSISALTESKLGKGLAVTAHAVIGGTAQAALPTFLQDPMVERFVVIQYGMNDSNGAGASAFETSIRSMLDRAKAVGRTPVLTGISKATAGEVGVRANLNLLLSQLANDYGALWANWPSTSGALMADGVHPADDYQQLLADKLTRVIVDAAPECGHE
jgi:lysophospholipase L1-like esterase/predicted small lipoprotein YifL